MTLEDINNDLKKYGIRNNSMVSEPPKEKKSYMISNNTSGVEPILNKKDNGNTNIENLYYLKKQTFK